MNINFLRSVWHKIHKSQSPCDCTSNTQARIYFEETKLLLGRILANSNANRKDVTDLSQIEYRVFSQFGDDGIIQYLISQLNPTVPFFVEFGVQNYREANTRFLLQNNNWHGLIIDSSSDDITTIKNDWYYWRHSLTALCQFVTKENINDLLIRSEVQGEIGLLHIDIDGNDYWVWEAIDKIQPIIVIIEFNSLFGRDRAITIPYSENFNRFDAHFSGLYFGASLKALDILARRKGYYFAGSNTAGVNAYFIRMDKGGIIPEVSVTDGYVESSFRQNRNNRGELEYITNEKAVEKLKGLLVYNVQSGEYEHF